MKWFEHSNAIHGGRPQSRRGRRVLVALAAVLLFVWASSIEREALAGQEADAARLREHLKSFQRTHNLSEPMTLRGAGQPSPKTIAPARTPGHLSPEDH